MCQNKKYEILVRYKTGDSFKTYDNETTIELRWNNLDIAKENLKRIKAHYEWYYDHNESYRWKERDPLPKPPYIDSKYEFRLYLKMDDGKEMIYSASSWCGFFERLYGAEIRECYDPEMRFDIE